MASLRLAAAFFTLSLHCVTHVTIAFSFNPSQSTQFLVRHRPTHCGILSTATPSTSSLVSPLQTSLYSSSVSLNPDDALPPPPLTPSSPLYPLNGLHYSQTIPVALGLRYANPYLSIKGKVLSMWGVAYALAALVVAAVTLPLMVAAAFVCDIRGNKRRRIALDWFVHYWAKATMMICGTRPRLYGAENLPKDGEVVVYVPNHTSFMDILLLSGFVPRPFKYLSKDEIRSIPVIGTAMSLAQHVFLKRDNLQSTLEVTDTCVQRLRDGNSMVLFAEGTRSPDGRLKMAKAAGVKVVPVSIGNLHRWMPKQALMPLAPIRHSFIKIHPAIDTKDIPVSQIRKECLEAVNSGLPPYQQIDA